MESASRTFSSHGYPTKYFVLLDSMVITDIKGGGIYKTDSSTWILKSRRFCE
ncbi:hypothetical protein AALB81_01850 [Lachnospiraceae bacterium 48-33]